VFVVKLLLKGLYQQLNFTFNMTGRNGLKIRCSFSKER